MVKQGQFMPTLKKRYFCLYTFGRNAWSSCFLIYFQDENSFKAANLETPPEKLLKENKCLGYLEIDRVEKSNNKINVVAERIFTIATRGDRVMRVAVDTVAERDAWIKALEGVGFSTTLQFPNVFTLSRAPTDESQPPQPPQQSQPARQQTQPAQPPPPPGYRRPTKPTWEPDNARGMCCHCQCPFSLSVRKHHCRCCGKIFCDLCSAARHVLPLGSRPSSHSPTHPLTHPLTHSLTRLGQSLGMRVSCSVCACSATRISRTSTATRRRRLPRQAAPAAAAVVTASGRYWIPPQQQ